ncbi:MAG: cryptochrome/photolyase family protein [Armatimonadia bacterium]|nr:cryptochrome/photolyase family protein [Armatimonadia bacterium]
MRDVIVLLGDQLDDVRMTESIDAERDIIWMAESVSEATHVWSHKARIALFLSAMRHFRDRLTNAGYRVRYHELGADADQSLEALLEDDVRELRPRRVLLTSPGEWRLLDSLPKACERAGAEVHIRPDARFLCGLDEFDEWAAGRNVLVHEHFYRAMRKRTGWLMEAGAPLGGEWNYDAENREALGPEGPGDAPPPLRFAPDETTRGVLNLVEQRFGDHPGSVRSFDWPVTPQQAKRALSDFVEHRLRRFGPYQDAQWMGMTYGYHSRLSSSLNLGLLDPRDAIEAAVDAHHHGAAPISSVEGFVRQILGWREYVRGIYWRAMPGYADENHLGADLPLPGFYWTGETDMECLRDVIGQTLRHGYAHHIQRLMVTGLFALLLGVEPARVHEWYLAIYVDAVEWVEMPNTLGMSQYADGGLMASKPYCASGKYLQRMSNYCDHCRFDPQRRAEEGACPFSTLYWDFLARNQGALSDNPRMALQLRNLKRIGEDEMRAIRRRAERLKASIGG